MAATSTLLTTSESVVFQRAPVFSALRSGVWLLFFLGSTSAIFRPGDCLFPAGVQRSGQSQGLIDGCLWL